MATAVEMSHLMSAGTPNTKYEISQGTTPAGLQNALLASNKSREYLSNDYLTSVASSNKIISQ